MVIAPPLITNEALSSSAMSVIAHREIEKYTNLFGYNWQQSQVSLKANDTRNRVESSSCAHARFFSLA